MMVMMMLVVVVLTDREAQTSRSCETGPIECYGQKNPLFDASTYCYFVKGKSGYSLETKATADRLNVDCCLCELVG